MKKRYTVKNYKGNITESLSNFKKKYPRMRIVEAIEQDDGRLDIAAEEKDIDKKTVAKAEKYLDDILSKIEDIVNDFKGDDNGGKVSSIGGEAIGMLGDILSNVLGEGEEEEESEGKAITEDTNPRVMEQSEKNWAEVRALSAKLPEALAILHNYVYKCNNAVAFDASKGMNNASSNIGDIREQMKAVQRLESEFDEYVDNDLM